jgi:hypothetical protein
VQVQSAADDSDHLAASLAEWLRRVEFADLDADATTALLTESVVAWAVDLGWRVYLRARSVATLPPPYESRHSWIDVACARPGDRPVVVEVDRTDRKRTIEKLVAEAGAGRVALWVRWGTGPFTAQPPASIRMITCKVDSHRKDGRRVFGSPVPDRPAPRHSDVIPSAEEVQRDLFEPLA